MSIFFSHALRAPKATSDHARPNIGAVRPAAEGSLHTTDRDDDDDNADAMTATQAMAVAIEAHWIRWAGSDAPDVVVHLLPGVGTADALDRALADDIDETLAALAHARAQGCALVLVSRLSAKALPVSVSAEVEACRAAARHARASALFADRLSHMAEQTRHELRSLGGASSGTAFTSAYTRAQQRAIEVAQRQALGERAAGWGFSAGSPWAARAYTASLAEMLVASAGDVPSVVVRIPAVLEDGILDELLSRAHNTAGALTLRAGARLFALPRACLAETIATVALGMARQPTPTPAVEVAPGTPLGAERLTDLLALHVRRHRAQQGETLLDRARRILHETQELAAHQGRLPVDPLSLAPPFFLEDTRVQARALRLMAVRAGVPPPSLEVDWRTCLLHDQLPSLEDKRRSLTQRDTRTPRPAWDSLGHLLAEAAERFGSRPALTYLSGDDVVDTSYSALWAKARAVAQRLKQAGVKPHDRVVLSGANHPAWGTVAFGVFLARATLVPLDPNLEEDQVRNIVRKARPTLAVVDKAARERFGGALPEPVLDLHLSATDGPGIDDDMPLPEGDDVASILFTSGTTGEPKGVQLSHRNFCALLASLQAIFPVGRGDRMLSVLPLHHTFEFSCGFLMPLASGARIFTPDALTGERVLYALKAGKITALVGVPALWQLLERRISKQVAERGELVQGLLEALLAANRFVAHKTGLSFGRVAFKPIHDGLGGHLRTLISGGSALPPSVHDMFQGLGLPLAEGYGLTEAAPVLTVAEGVLGAPAGTVGRPIPGVEVQIVDADPHTGIGEIYARAPNVMKGYFEDEAATRATLEDGWLKTGDLGTFDSDGRLRILGRSKDVVVTATGENIYLDDIEKKLEALTSEGLVSQAALVGLSDPRGGERLALAYVVAEGKDGAAVHKAVAQQILKLPAFARPSVVEAVVGPLPLTSTRKVKRKDVRKMLEARIAMRGSETNDAVDVASLPAVRAAIATVAGVDVKKVTSSTRFAVDLGFDSLMWTELGAALSPLLGSLAPENLVQQQTVAELEHLVRTTARAPTTGDDTTRAAEQVERLTRPVGPRGGERRADRTGFVEQRLLPVIKPFGRAAITVAQRDMFRSVFDARVTGRAFIPHNRNTIVVANHTSHLDTGLVKFALGSYGAELRPLAAKDYFFEGNRAKVAFIEHFTNLVPIDRETGSGLAFEQARAVVEQGHVTLIFPEGTRRDDGTLGVFKPLVARLALQTKTDVLPVWMKGNHEALPRGALIPNLEARTLEAHIGPPLPASELARLTAHLAPVQQARVATDIIRRAIVALSEGRMLELTKVTSLDMLERGVVARTDAA